MKVTWNYGQSAVTLPGDVCKSVPMADEASLRVILALIDPAVATAPDIASALVGATRLSMSAVQKALDFWQKKGVFTITLKDEKDTEVPEMTAAAVKVTLSMPEYSTDEIGNLLEKRHELADFVDVCNQLWGKMMNRHEISKIVALSDYYALGTDYLSEVFAYMAQENRKSVAMVEKIVLQMMEEGITDTAALRERLTLMRRVTTFEGEVRTLFGLQSRALSAKEKKMVLTWTNEYGYDIEIVRRAYDITVDAIGKPALPYANAVLERWFCTGVKTVADAEADGKQRLGQGNGSGSTYETDDAFADALRRSYGADYDKMGLNLGKGPNV